MKQLKAIEYTIDGHENIEDFAKGILTLTNAKSSRAGTILDIKTHEGTNVVTVTSLVDIGMFIEFNMGKIDSKEEVNVYQIGFEELERLEGVNKLDEDLDTGEEPLIFVEE